MNKYRVSYTVVMSCAELILADNEDKAKEILMSSYALTNPTVESIEVNNVSEELAVPEDQFLNFNN
jgi:phosphoribosylformylglycinamidine (FGAM) synthase PurS component